MVLINNIAPKYSFLLLNHFHSLMFSLPHSSSIFSSPDQDHCNDQKISECCAKRKKRGKIFHPKYAKVSGSELKYLMCHLVNKQTANT